MGLGGRAYSFSTVFSCFMLMYISFFFCSRRICTLSLEHIAHMSYSPSLRKVHTVQVHPGPSSALSSSFSPTFSCSVFVSLAGASLSCVGAVVVVVSSSLLLSALSPFSSCCSSFFSPESKDPNTVRVALSRVFAAQ